MPSTNKRSSSSSLAINRVQPRLLSQDQFVHKSSLPSHQICKIYSCPNVPKSKTKTGTRVTLSSNSIFSSQQNSNYFSLNPGYFHNQSWSTALVDRSPKLQSISPHYDGNVCLNPRLFESNKSHRKHSLEKHVASVQNALNKSGIMVDFYDFPLTQKDNIGKKRDIKKHHLTNNTLVSKLKSQSGFNNKILAAEITGPRQINYTHQPHITSQLAHISMPWCETLIAQMRKHSNRDERIDKDPEEELRIPSKQLDEIDNRINSLQCLLAEYNTLIDLNAQNKLQNKKLEITLVNLKKGHSKSRQDPNQNERTESLIKEVIALKMELAQRRENEDWKKLELIRLRKERDELSRTLQSKENSYQPSLVKQKTSKAGITTIEISGQSNSLSNIFTNMKDITKIGTNRNLSMKFNHGKITQQATNID